MEEQKDIVNRLVDYFKGAYEELNKVTWPTKKQTKNYTLVVIGLSVAMLVFFTVLDYLLEFGIKQVI